MGAVQIRPRILNSGVSMVAEWWVRTTCGHNSSKKGIRRFFPNVLDDTRKFGSVPIMELEPFAIRSGVCSPCGFESYTLRLTRLKLCCLLADGLWFGCVIYVCLLVRKRSPKPLTKVRCFPGVLVFIST